jgi:glycerate kinase
MAAALGIAFFAANDEEIDPIPANLLQLRRVDFKHRIALPEIIAACDVDHPLLGPRGATAIFSGQKGAAPEDKTALEAALAHLVTISRGGEAALMPGAGAAGGLGFGLLRFADAKLVSGFDLLARLLDLETRVKAADHVITGEGSLDHQSLGGKGPVALARLANRLSVPVTGFCGQADDSARASRIFRSIHALADTGLPLATLISRAGPLLTARVVEAGLGSP